MSSAPKTRELEKHVLRWQSRKMEKEAQRKDLPTNLPRTVIPQKDSNAKKRKPVPTRADDDDLTNQCVGIANRHVNTLINQQPEGESTSRRMKTILLPDVPRDAARKRETLTINTDIRPMEDFDLEHPPVQPEIIEEDPDAKYVISESALQGLPSLRNILDKQYRYFVRRDSEKVQQGITASPKPVISAKHVAKVLFEPYGVFGPCVLAATGECCAQTEAALKHPLSPESLPCMSYCTPEEFTAVAWGFQRELLSGNMCEFCERYAINMYVLQKGIESHVAEIERPNRYYKSGEEGEYSRRGMIQPTQVKGARFTEGVFGDVRCWNTSDFVPIIGVVEPNSMVVDRIISVEQYSDITEQHRNDSGEKYLRGWREVKPFFTLNERAFLETHQINPYQRTFVDTDREIDVAVVLQGYFERREKNFPNIARIYSDLMECVNNPTFLPTFMQSEKWSDSLFQTWCLHKFNNPPDPATHIIYYTVMIRCNLAQHFLIKMGVPLELQEKIRLFIAAHMPLIYWMDQSQTISDEALLSLTYDGGLELYVPVLMAHYPKYETHYRRSDIEFIKLVRYTYSRRDPLDITYDYYITQCEQRYDMLLHSNLPTVDQLLYKITNRSLSSSVYNRITADYEKLCARLSMHRRSTWPPLQNKNPQRSEVSSRKEWRAQRNTELLIDMRRELEIVLAILQEENDEYYNLLTYFVKTVMCPFMTSVSSIYELEDSQIEALVEFFACFETIFPPEEVVNIVITPQTVNGRPWRENILLLTTLLRVTVMERLHAMEMPEQTELRYNLHLLRNSHLRLVRKITENRPILYTDQELLAVEPDKMVSIFDIHRPEPRGELHQGMLPDVLDGLVNVDFMGNSGMDEQELIKILFKVLDRCCNGREFPIMLSKMCEQNRDFNRLVMLMLELALKGLFEHDTERVSFYRSLVLDEMFEHNDDPRVWTDIQRFIRDNPTLAKEAISESFCYMLKYVPHLRDMLTEVYEDLDDWQMRVIANMDMVRHCFTATGDYSRVSDVVYKRVHLDSNKKIYRHAELGFVNFMCDQIREFDIGRYAKRIVFTEGHISAEQRMMVDAFVRCISPIQVIKLETLKLIFMAEKTLDVIGAITQLFDDSGAKLSGSGAKRENTNPVHEQFLELSLNQYNLMSYFFESLRRYQNIRAIRITNLTVLKQQLTKLCERRGVRHVSELPSLATKVAYSPCCSYFKNGFPIRQNQKARGFDEIILNITDNTFTCGKKEHKPSNRQTAPRAIRMGKKVEIFNTKVARQQEREHKKPSCRTTEVMVLDVVGEVIETQTSAKIPKAKKQKDTTSKRRRKNLPPPTPPLWLTPCCGTIYSYDWQVIP